MIELAALLRPLSQPLLAVFFCAVLAGMEELFSVSLCSLGVCVGELGISTTFHLANLTRSMHYSVSTDGVSGSPDCSFWLCEDVANDVEGVIKSKMVFWVLFLWLMPPWDGKGTEEARMEIKS